MEGGAPLRRLLAAALARGGLGHWADLQPQLPVALLVVRVAHWAVSAALPPISAMSGD